MHVGWPLYKRFGHAFEGFKQMVANADEILKSLVKEVKETDPETGKEVKSSATLANVACLDWRALRGCAGSGSRGWLQFRLAFNQGRLAGILD